METEKIVVPPLRLVLTNLIEVLEAQVRCLIAYAVHREVGVNEAKFLDDAMSLARQYSYSRDLLQIGLKEVGLMHYGVRDRYLCEVGNIDPYADPDKFRLYFGVTMPEAFCIVQSQFGIKYKGFSPDYVRERHHPLEQLGIPKEGLTFHLYDPALPEKPFCIDFPGAVSEYGMVPYLSYSSDERPTIEICAPQLPFPTSGSMTVYRGS